LAAFKVKLKFKLQLKCATAADVWQESPRNDLTKSDIIITLLTHTLTHTE